MDPCIKRLSENIHTFMDGLSAGNEQVDWSARVVGFRDTETDREKDWFVGLDNHAFVKTAGELKIQLNALQAKFGGIGEAEIPETGLDALWAVSHAADWDPIGSMHRVIVLLSDAPTKDIVTDNVADPPLSHNDDVQDLGQFLAGEHFKVQIYALDCPSYERLGQLPNGDFFDVSSGAAGDTYLGLENLDFDKIAQYLYGSITGSALPVGNAPAAPPVEEAETSSGTQAGTVPEQPTQGGPASPSQGGGPSLPPGGTQEA